MRPTASTTGRGRQCVRSSSSRVAPYRSNSPHRPSVPRSYSAASRNGLRPSASLHSSATKTRPCLFLTCPRGSLLATSYLVFIIEIAGRLLPHRQTSQTSNLIVRDRGLYGVRSKTSHRNGAEALMQGLGGRRNTRCPEHRHMFVLPTTVGSDQCLQYLAQ